MGASMATINSIISNTDASVFFYVVTLRDAVKLTRCIFELQKYEPHPSIVAQSEDFSPNLPFVSRVRRYIEKTKLKGIRYKIVEFNPMVLVGKVKPDSSRPDLLHPVSAASACVPSAEPSTEFLSQRNKNFVFAAQLCAVLPPSARHPPLQGDILR